MSNAPKLIVMLTQNDITLKNAYEIFERSKASKAEIWGFKGEGISPEKMKDLFSYMKSCGKQTVLEAVVYTEEEGILSAEKAVYCGVDILMGTMYSDKINELCRNNGIKYMPFVGEVSGVPSVLDGTADEMICQANELLKKGVFGFDLLGYRYTGDAGQLIRSFVAGVNAPVCVAGSVDNIPKIDEVSETAPWAFTIGGAFCQNIFGPDFISQIDFVCDRIKK